MIALRRRTFALVPLMVLLGLSGCSSDSAAPTSYTTTKTATSSSTTSSPSQPTASATASDKEAELRQAVQTYSDAFLSNKPAEAYAFLSKKCSEKMPPDQFAQMLQKGAELYGAPLKIESFSAHFIQGVDGAMVTYTYSVPALNQDKEIWMAEGGSWKMDSC